MNSAQFSTPHIYFQPHTNAVLDMAFSSDDHLLATASGDQTARIIDMKTQLTKFIFQGHHSSVKQVRFQSGNDNVIATSSRDGNVQIWDTRCRGSESVLQEKRTPMDPTSVVDTVFTHKVTYANTYTTIADAHGDRHGSSSIGRLDGVHANQR